MEKYNEESLLREIRSLTARLNSVHEYVKILNEKFSTAHSSEERFYDFLGECVDKLIHYQESKIKNLK